MRIIVHNRKMGGVHAEFSASVAPVRLLEHKGGGSL